MKRSRDILTRIKDDEILRQAGLTEDEIKELSELRQDYEDQETTFKRTLEIEKEMTNLQRRE